jgi:plastocyanin
MKHGLFLALIGLGASVGAPAAASSPPAVSASTQKVPASVTVTIEAFQFSPSPLKIAAGTPVVFVNKDATPHTVTPDDGKSFQGTGRIVSGASKRVVFEKPGTFNYYCEIHTTMHGKVVVR